MELSIDDNDLPAFIAYLAWGVLEAIRVGAVPATVGIWTLGPPRMWEPLEQASLVPREIIKVLSTSDELSSIQKLAPDTFERTLVDLIAQVRNVLETLPDQTWSGRWQATT